MADRPILFSAPMVRALLAGTKTQTRRMVKPQPPTEAKDAGVIGSGDPKSNGIWVWLDDTDIEWCSPIGDEFRCPYGVPGDRLWVKETHALAPDHGLYGVRYFATDAVHDLRKRRPSIHMPRWASRLTLTISDVRIQRLKDISEEDAMAEGLKWVVPGMWSVDSVSVPVVSHDPRVAYFQLWDHINGEGAAAANPWVWAVSFEVQKANIGAKAA